MTISSSIRSAGPFICDGQSAVFPFAFKVFSPGEVLAVLSDGTTETSLEFDSAYSVTLNKDQTGNPGGTVTLLGAPPSAGRTLTLTSSVQDVQGMALTNLGGFHPKVIENAFDRLVILIQQLRGMLNRSLRFPLSEIGINAELPAKAARVNRLLSFNAQGTPVMTDFDVAGLMNARDSAITSAAAAVAARASAELHDVSAGQHELGAQVANAGANSSAQAAAAQVAIVAAQVAAVTPTVVQYLGDGAKKTFVLPSNPGSENNLAVSVNGLVVQHDQFNIDGTNLIFATAPAAPAVPGQNNIEVRISTGVVINVSSAADASFLPGGVGAMVRSVQEKLRETVSVKDFGALGDGVADDTAAVQRALASPALHVHFPAGGVYRITDPLQDGTAALISTLPGRRITCDGTITATTTVLRAIDVQGDDSFVQLNVAGNSKIACGVQVSGARCTVKGCDIRDLYTTTFSAVGIEAKTNGGVYIRANRMRNLVSVGDSSLGNGNGMARGIALSMSAPAIRASIIESNVIEQCLGEEGDAVTIHASNGAGTYYVADVTLRDNVIDTFTRRAIKVQAHKTRIQRNQIKSSITDLATIPNRMTVIDIVQGGDCFIQDNILDSCKGFKQISVFAVAPEVFDNFYIERNKIFGLGAETPNDCIFISSRGANVFIRTNDLQAGTGVVIAVGAVTNCVIESNTISCIDEANTRVISTTSVSVKVIIRANALFAGVRQCFVGNDSLNAIVSDNHVKANTPLFRNSSGNSNALVVGNSLDGTAGLTSASGTLTGNRFGGNYNMGGQTNTAPGPLFVFSSSGPTVALAGLQIQPGQVVFDSSPAASAGVGWIAMTAGLAEAVTWKPFGTISA